MREPKRKIEIAREKLKQNSIDPSNMEEGQKEELIIKLFKKDIKGRKQWYKEKIKEVEEKGCIELDDFENRIFNKFVKCKSNKFKNFTEEEERLWGDIFIYDYIRNNLDFFKKHTK